MTRRVPIQEEALLVQEDDSSELCLCCDLCSTFSLSLSSPQTSQGEGGNLQIHGQLNSLKMQQQLSQYLKRKENGTSFQLSVKIYDYLSIKFSQHQSLLLNQKEKVELDFETNTSVGLFESSVTRAQEYLNIYTTKGKVKTEKKFQLRFKI